MPEYIELQREEAKILIPLGLSSNCKTAQKRRPRLAEIAKEKLMLLIKDFNEYSKKSLIIRDEQFGPLGYEPQEILDLCKLPESEIAFEEMLKKNWLNMDPYTRGTKWEKSEEE